MRHSAVRVLILGLLGCVLASPGPLPGCSYNLDPTIGIGTTAERNNGSLLWGVGNVPEIMSVDVGQPVELRAFWGNDANGNGQIQYGEWGSREVATRSEISRMLGAKMGELTSRGGWLDPRNLFSPTSHNAIQGARGCFKVQYASVSSTRAGTAAT